MKVGLTGGIGCGKSTVVELFRDAGWSAIESDAIVRELLASDESVKTKLRDHWGEAILAEDGSIDRKAVAQRVFSDEADLRWLESVLHPLVREQWERAVAAAPDQNWLVEIPLLFEKRLETLFDLTVCVSSAPDVVESRMRTRGYSRDEIEQRRERQLPLEQKIERADHLISNSGSLDFLKLQTTRLIEQITAE